MYYDVIKLLYKTKQNRIINYKALDIFKSGLLLLLKYQIVLFIFRKAINLMLPQKLFMVSDKQYRYVYRLLVFAYGR